MWNFHHVVTQQAHPTTSKADTLARKNAGSKIKAIVNKYFASTSLLNDDNKKDDDFTAPPPTKEDFAGAAPLPTPEGANDAAVTSATPGNVAGSSPSGSGIEQWLDDQQRDGPSGDDVIVATKDEV